MPVPPIAVDSLVKALKTLKPDQSQQVVDPCVEQQDQENDKNTRDQHDHGVGEELLPVRPAHALQLTPCVLEK